MRSMNAVPLRELFVKGTVKPTKRDFRRLTIVRQWRPNFLARSLYARWTRAASFLCFLRLRNNVTARASLPGLSVVTFLPVPFQVLFQLGLNELRHKTGTSASTPSRDSFLFDGALRRTVWRIQKGIQRAEQ